ncbi:hypothetical protein [Candidatus Entotheonella palauensis]|uniref:hypothetical protein n=1 Tax=Candidatus Entotheonella palauensis TaxID=93172 RepID=UPI000B7D21DA|nr:hypothetical protein [Candidatus Entotheonella palauensis]
MKLRLLCILFLFAILQGCVMNTYTKGVREPERTEGLQAPAPQGQYQPVTLQGPGTFISAEIVKQGGNNDLSFIILDIDGRNVVNLSVAEAKNTKLTQDNPYGLALISSTGNIKTFTIGFSTPLSYESSLTLSVDVQEDGVDQILANVIHGK